MSPGVHAAYSKYFIRRVRIATGSPLVAACKLKGFQLESQRNFDGTKNHNVSIVSFPRKSPDGSVYADELTAVQQLENVKRMQKDWSDNAVSVTVTFKYEELDDIKEWLRENYEHNMKSVSFLLYSGHGFIQAPYEDISEDVYNQMTAKLSDIPIEKCLANILKSNRIVSDVQDLENDLIHDSNMECTGGSCPVR